MTAVLEPASTTAHGDDFVIEAPRTRKQRPTGNRAKTNFELYAWLFMRISGLVLVVTVLGHLFIMLTLDGGVSRINFSFVAGRYASPFWRLWDETTLVLAELHGTNGLRTIINDYSTKDTTRFWLKMLLFTSAALVTVLGSIVIFTFDPDLH